MQSFKTILGGLLAIVLSAGTVFAQIDFTTKPIVTGLTIPWSMQELPDGRILFTQRNGVISRMHPDSGIVTNLLDIRSTVLAERESGLLGMQLDNDFENNGYIYVAVTLGTSAEDVVKYVLRYTLQADTLVDADTVLRFEQSGTVHQGGRLLMLKDNTMLYGNGDYDMGPLATQWDNYFGKVMRFNLDGTAPEDNPVPGSLAWTVGHRNPQGLLLLPNGDVISSEHGDFVSDELNILRGGGNYGWPFVEGICDKEHELPYCDSVDVTMPLWCTGDFTNAPCGMTWYDNDRYPTLKHSVLVGFLKSGFMMQFKMNEDLQSVDTAIKWIPWRQGRIRDVISTRDGRIFICTGNRGILAKELARDEDDGIYELLPLETTAAPNIGFDTDTVRVRAVPGFERVFYINVCNNGETPTTLINSYPTQPSDAFTVGDYELHSMEAGACRARKMFYHPQAAETYTAEFNYQAVDALGDNLTTKQITVVGTTDIGLLRPVSDTIRITGTVGGTLTGILQLTNVGSDTVSVVSGMFAAFANLFTVDLTNVPNPIHPSDTVDIPVTFIENVSGDYTTTLTISTTSYLQPKIVVQADVTATSVWEYTYPRSEHFSIKPNPTTGAVTITADTEIRTIIVRDLMGRIVYTASGNGLITTMNLRSIPTGVSSGTYSVTCETASGMSSAILVITE